MHDLSVGERQRIEIVRCLLQNPKLLIMDEPTSVLTPSEVQKLFVTLRRLAAEGCSILYISHKLEEVRALCSAATIMRLGRNVADVVPAEKTVKELAEIMINADLHAPTPRPPPQGEAKPRLVLDRLTIRSPHHFGTDLKDISLSIAGGEILGIAGIAGNGQSELMDALSGEILAGQPENVMIDGVPAGIWARSERRRIRGCFVPEERNGHGAVTTMTLAENAFLSGFVRHALVRFGVIDNKRTHDFAANIITTLRRPHHRPESRRRARCPAATCRNSWWGARFCRIPALLVINQPTWGVDAGAALAIHEAIMALAQAGAGGDDHLAGPGRDLRAGRPHRGDRRRARCRSRC